MTGPKTQQPVICLPGRASFNQRFGHHCAFTGPLIDEASDKLSNSPYQHLKGGGTAWIVKYTWDVLLRVARWTRLSS
jgi:hypothetical protein